MKPRDNGTETRQLLIEAAHVFCESDQGGHDKGCLVLEDLVYDASDSGEAASTINNQGMAGQLEFLLRAGTREEDLMELARAEFPGLLRILRTLQRKEMMQEMLPEGEIRRAPKL